MMTSVLKQQRLKEGFPFSIMYRNSTTTAQSYGGLEARNRNAKTNPKGNTQGFFLS